jgi:dCTP deaminase
MILSNTEIVKGLANGLFKINGLPSLDPSSPPFNTSAVDLRLGSEIIIPTHGQTQIDLSASARGGIAVHWANNSRRVTISEDQPYSLRANTFVLSHTLESVDFPINASTPCFAARVEGKSSLARCGLLVHFTAPTIHAGFAGSITLEIINLGPSPILLFPRMPICQLIIEQVHGTPTAAPNQFHGQTHPAGVL